MRDKECYAKLAILRSTPFLLASQTGDSFLFYNFLQSYSHHRTQIISDVI